MTTPDATPFVELGDDVLTLRCLRPDDAPALLAGEDEDQVRWLNGGHRSEPARTREWIEQNREQWRTGGARRHLGVLHVATGRLIGTVEAHLAMPGAPTGAVNISYAVFPAARGHGYAACAVRLVCAWLAVATAADTALIRVDAANTPSVRVARDAGFRATGTDREGLVHHVRALRDAPHVALVCGPAGAGKSTLAHRLAALGAVHLSFDEDAWRLGHRTHPLPAHVADALHADLRTRLVALARQGRDVVVDTSFWSRASRTAYRELVRPYGVEPVTMHLATPHAQVMDRLAARAGSGPHDVLVPPDLARRHLAGFEVPTRDEGPLVVLRAD
ncbi:GNAT family N-acetyltransferase [Cellulomonas sp.]|uniref:GNAT family N-acetyltransferase n=1 Tax=Cellulomonas sp. TaxID=40001 RepID=UPI00258D0A46|nr:GNAT family N-acetyltransferase [Cellulomonas sp.]MCR6688764.1 GNAT family N-acetyltransferase [Cellulomonas sp.]